MTALTMRNRRRPRTLTRRLLPLQIAMGLQGFMLWVPVEKLFQTSIGFDAASIGVMAAAYAAVVPLLEVPSGILADRWSRNGLMVMASAALGASSLLGGLSHHVTTYVVAAMILSVYFAFSSGTVDSMVYDTVLEETGTSDLYEGSIGHMRIVESAALAASAVVGGLLAGWTSPRATYFLTVPFALAAIIAFLIFEEPRLHRSAEPVSLRRHVATTFSAMTRVPQIRKVMLVAALAALLSQALFEFGPLWLVALHAPTSAFGPYWAALVAMLGLGGYLTAKLHLERGRSRLVLAAALTLSPVLLATSGSVVAVSLAQTAVALLVAILGIHAGLLLHNEVPSEIRAGVSSGVGTLSWLLFLPFSLGFGWLIRAHGVHRAGWVLVGVAALLAILITLPLRTLAQRTPPAELDAAQEPPVLVDVAAPTELACRDLVALVTDYLDDKLPGAWRTRVEEHLTDCDGCTSYLHQLRVIVDALAHLDLDRPPPRAVSGSDDGA